MQNERGMFMKRVLCVLVFACFVLSCAYADNVHEFSEYALVFGSLPPLDSMSEQDGEYTVYTVKDCKITFKGEESIFVQGNGVDFLAYCMSAIMTFEPDAGKLKDNAGLLFGNFLLSRGGDMKTWDTAGGLTAMLKPDETEVIFAVGK